MAGTDLNLLVQQRQAKIESLQQQQQAVADQLAQINGNASSVEVQLGDRRVSLERAVVELNNFTIPCTLDEPDRAAFTTTRTEIGEDGSEVEVEEFDQAAFDAEYKAYQESVRVAEEAEQERAALEEAVRTATGEVTGYENDLNQLLQAAQAKEDELAAVNSDYNVSMSELDDLNQQINQREQEITTLRTTKTSRDGSTTTTDYDAQTGQAKKQVVRDANGNMVSLDEVYDDNPEHRTLRRIEFDPNNAGNRTVSITRDGVTVVTTVEDEEITSRVATSSLTGNQAVYDGHGNTELVVKAGESPDLIYNKFYGNSEENAQNRQNLIDQFKQKVVSINGQPLPENYEPTDNDLKHYFYKVAGFREQFHTTEELFMKMLPEEEERMEAQGRTRREQADDYANTYMREHRREVRLENGGILQAGQTLTIPTEINPDHPQLQNRDAATERARGNAAERQLQAERAVDRINTQVEEDRQRVFAQAFLDQLNNTYGGYALETQRQNNEGGSTAIDAHFSNAYLERMRQNISGLDANSSFDEIALAIAKGTGAANQDGILLYSDKTGKPLGGSASVYVTGSDIEKLYNDMQRLAANPNDTKLQQSIQQRWDTYTGRRYVVSVSQNRAENNMMGRFVQSVMADAMPGRVSGAVASASTSAMQGNSVGEVILDGVLGTLDGPVGTLKSILTEKAITKIYDVMDSSTDRTEKLKTCLHNISNMNQQEQEHLAEALRGKTPRQQAAILEEYARTH